MNCQDIVSEIIARPGRETSEEVKLHLATCGACSDVYRQQQDLWRQLDAWEAPEISAGFDRRLYARIGRRAYSPWTPLGGLLGLLHPTQLPFAAALACVLFLATVVIERDHHVTLPAEAAVAIHPVEKEDLKQIETALDDIQMLSDFEALPVGYIQSQGKS